MLISLQPQQIVLKMLNSILQTFTNFIHVYRKHRDRISNGVHHQNVTSTSETGGSEVEDEFCSPVDVCLACMPMETLRCCICQGQKRSSNTASVSNQRRQLWFHAFVLFVFAVALAGLSYYTMTLQNQLAVLSMHLDPGKTPFAF